MNTTAVKAGALALVTQGVALLVGYGVVNNAQAGKWTAISVGVVNAIFLVIHAWHSQTDANTPATRKATGTSTKGTK